MDFADRARLSKLVTIAHARRSPLLRRRPRLFDSSPLPRCYLALLSSKYVAERNRALDYSHTKKLAHVVYERRTRTHVPMSGRGCQIRCPDTLDRATEDNALSLDFEDKTRAPPWRGGPIYPMR